MAEDSTGWRQGGRENLKQGMEEGCIIMQCQFPSVSVNDSFGVYLEPYLIWDRSKI